MSINLKQTKKKQLMDIAAGAIIILNMQTMHLKDLKTIAMF
jgi:hypothetical protein